MRRDQPLLRCASGSARTFPWGARIRTAEPSIAGQPTIRPSTSSMAMQVAALALPMPLAFVEYLNDPTGSAEQLAVAVFRQTDGGYQFVKRLPSNMVGNLAPGTAVRFQNGQASWAAEALRAGDSRSMATGRKQVTVSIR